MKYILGCDPGLNGAFCLYDPTLLIKGKVGEVVLEDMPVLEILRNGKKRHQIDLYALARWIDTHAKTIKHAYIENPQGMPNMASNATYRLGLNCGIVQMAVASAFIPMTLIPPATWKKKMGIGKDKDGSRLKASQLLPHYSELWERKKDDGRAESFLLAWFGFHHG